MTDERDQQGGVRVPDSDSEVHAALSRAARADDAIDVLTDLLTAFDAQRRRRDARALAESVRPVSIPLRA